VGHKREWAGYVQPPRRFRLASSPKLEPLGPSRWLLHLLLAIDRRRGRPDCLCPTLCHPTIPDRSCQCGSHICRPFLKTLFRKRFSTVSRVLTLYSTKHLLPCPRCSSRHHSAVQLESANQTCKQLSPRSRLCRCASDTSLGKCKPESGSAGRSLRPN